MIEFVHEGIPVYQVLQKEMVKSKPHLYLILGWIDMFEYTRPGMRVKPFMEIIIGFQREMGPGDEM